MELLSMAEATQHGIVKEFIEGRLSEEEALERLLCHRSTLYRKVLRVEEGGIKGLIHQLRGKSSNNRGDASLRDFVCDLYDQEYRRFGFTVAHFYQEAAHQFPRPVGYSTLVRWFKEEKLTTRAHKGVKHHSRRPRREAFGDMLQMDTSIHDWLDWKKNLSLVAAMDDCTNVICGAHLALGDTTLANMTVLRQVIASYGLFGSLYVDKSPIFKVTRTGGIGRINQPTFKAPYITQVKRALGELNIKLIYAHSPQAKGRIERSFGVWQKRLIPELRKNGIRDLEKANQYIQEVYVPGHNERFAEDPSKYRNLFVPFKHRDLNYVLAEHYQLIIPNDHFLSSKKAGIQLKILPSSHRLSYAKAKVDLFKHINGKISVLYKGERLHFIPYSS